MFKDPEKVSFPDLFKSSLKNVFKLFSLSSCLCFPHLRSKAWISLFHVYLKTIKQLPLYSLLSLKTIKSNFIHLYSLFTWLLVAGNFYHLALSLPLRSLSLCTAEAPSISELRLSVAAVFLCSSFCVGTM